MSYYNLDATFRPIDAWPGEQTRSRRRSRFDTPWSATLELLKRELRELGAKNIVIQMALDEDQIRRDGYPRAHATPTHPGIILAFESRHGPLKYPCDTFTRWEDNLRAIALALEALRKVDRYGVTRRGEQYRGWAKLPPAGATTATFTAESAAAFMAAACGNGGTASAILGSALVAGDAYRKAAKRLHPDAGGTDREFQLLGIAKQILEKHHGGLT
jgi:hypothetical protein